jgi:hypothetical protein
MARPTPPRKNITQRIHRLRDILRDKVSRKRKFRTPLLDAGGYIRHVR